MIQAKCIEKFRDKQGKIYGYRIQDKNGQTKDVTSDALKNGISNGMIDIINLTLTADRRLVDKNEEKHSKNRKSMLNKVTKTCSEDIRDEIINKTKAITSTYTGDISINYYGDYDADENMTTSMSENIEIDDNTKICIWMWIKKHSISFQLQEVKGDSEEVKLKYFDEHNIDVLNTSVEKLDSLKNAYIDKVKNEYFYQ